MSSFDWSAIAQAVTMVVAIAGLGSVARLRANAKLADERAENLERMLKSERADRLDSEARCSRLLEAAEARRETDRRVSDREISRLEGRVAALVDDMGYVIAEAVVHAMRSDPRTDLKLPDGSA